MPNWVINNVSMTGPQKSIDAVLELLKSKDTESPDIIDFNNVIKMPDSLNLVCGGCDRDYVAVYLASLKQSEKLSLAAKLLETPTSFYGNYFKKYDKSFVMPVPEERRQYLEESFREAYANLNPSSIEDVGKAYIENILNYGADTWYDWRIENWGTKWDFDNCSIGVNSFSFDTAWSASLPITKRLSEMFPDVVFCHEYADEDIGSNCGRYVFAQGEITEEYLPEGKEAVRFACGFWDYDASEYLAEREEEESLAAAPLDAQISSATDLKQPAEPDIKKEPDLVLG